MTNLMIRIIASAYFWLAFGMAVSTGSDETADTTELEKLREELNSQAAEIRTLRERLDKQDSIFGPAQSDEDSECDVAPTKNRIPVVVEQKSEPSCSGDSKAPKFHLLKYYADYDGGFMIRPIKESKPFQLKMKAWIQFRHHGFARDVNSWTDNAGVTRPVRNRNAFDIERARLTFAGHAIDKRMTYFLQLDGDTDGRHVVDFFDYLWAWEFSDLLRIEVGKRKAPAGRQWLLGARSTRLIDRPMAIDFFRPDRSVGIFGVGKIGKKVHYQFMVGNGYQTANLPNSLTDDRLTFAATNYFDCLGDFGSQIVDYENTSDPRIRLGHSFVFSPNSSDELGNPLAETSFLRLADGTRITAAEALTPGVTVSDFDIYFYGVDAAARWRGWSVNAELFMRWIEQIRGDGMLTTTDIFQRGYYVEGGRFLIPKRLDINARYSQVSDPYGNASEIAIGFNFYPKDTPRLKLSFDVTSLDGSPLQNTATDILVGDDGTLFRTQFQVEF